MAPKRDELGSAKHHAWLHYHRACVDCGLSVQATTQLILFGCAPNFSYDHPVMVLLRKSLLVLSLVIASSTAARADTNESSGLVQVVDGDTITLSGTNIHLFGVDAPELKQQCRIYQLSWPCGERAVVLLERLIANRPVRCEIVRQGAGSTDKLVQAHCFNYENVNLNSAIIGAGMAVPILKQTRRYVTAGYSAQIQRLGLWSGRFILPKQWREGKRFRPLGKPFKRKVLKD